MNTIKYAILLSCFSLTQIGVFAVDENGFPQFAANYLFTRGGFLSFTAVKNTTAFIATPNTRVLTQAITDKRESDEKIKINLIQDDQTSLRKPAIVSGVTTAADQVDLQTTNVFEPGSSQTPTISDAIKAVAVKTDEVILAAAAQTDGVISQDVAQGSVKTEPAQATTSGVTAAAAQTDGVTSQDAAQGSVKTEPAQATTSGVTAAAAQTDGVIAAEQTNEIPAPDVVVDQTKLELKDVLTPAAETAPVVTTEKKNSLEGIASVPSQTQASETISVVVEQQKPEEIVAATAPSTKLEAIVPTTTQIIKPEEIVAATAPSTKPEAINLTPQIVGAPEKIIVPATQPSVFDSAIAQTTESVPEQ